jgi:hypothetical protein
MTNVKDRNNNQGLGWGESYINPPFGPPHENVDGILGVAGWRGLERRTLREVCSLYLEVYKMRLASGRLSTKALRYCTSSVLKYNFSNLMTICAIDNQGYTITEISKELFCSRQQATVMVNDCLAEGWIIESKPRHYVGSPSFLEVGMQDFLPEFLEALGNTQMLKMVVAHKTLTDVRLSDINKRDTKE